MTKDAETVAMVALLRRKGAKWRDIADEVLERGSALALLRDTAPDPGLFDSGPGPDDEIAAAAEAILGWTAKGVAVHSILSPTYPERLRSVYQMPPLLFTRGTLTKDDRSVAVVGTRGASERGLRTASTVAATLSAKNVTVVSGLAAGIDTAAHKSALQVGGRTVAVIGTGILQSYPPENTALQEEIANRGLVISQFWPDARPSQQSFPMRNAVMSGYAAATVVIEAPWKSGARMQARLALEHGRPVVLTNHLLEHDWAREYAERPGVSVVSSPDELADVVEALINEPQAAESALAEFESVVPR